MGNKVAIVGIGCIFPESPNPRAFWKNLIQGIQPFAHPPPDRWDWETYYSPDRGDCDKTYCILGAFLHDFEFPWRKYRIPPHDVARLNPIHLVLLETISQAVEDAGLETGSAAAERTAFLLGSVGCGIRPDLGLQVRWGDYLGCLQSVPEFQGLPDAVREGILERAGEAVRRHFVEISEENMLGAFGSLPLGRASKIFGLRGPHFVVDAGYASSHAAIDQGLQMLAQDTCDQVMVAAASPWLFVQEFVTFCRLGALSSQHLLPFDERADGTLFGEGAGAVVLKRLEDALRDRNKIYGVICGLGACSNGAGPALFAPSRDAEASAVRSALAQAEWDSSRVQYVECHATGTPLGDRVEILALQDVFQARTGHDRLSLGAVKECTGHLQSAAGMAGLLKTALALHHGILPPQHRFQRPQADMKLEETGFTVPTRADGWKTPSEHDTRRACVNAFGFGGVNYSLCLEAAPAVLVRRFPPTKEKRSSGIYRGPIAIVGMGAVFPGADDVASFWKNSLNKVDAVSDVPPGRFAIDRYYDPSGTRRGFAHTRLGAFVHDVPPDPRTSRIPPNVLPQIDGTQRLVLRACAEALASAGFPGKMWDTETTAVIIGDLPQREREMEASLRITSAEYAIALEEVIDREGVREEIRDQILGEAERRFKQGFLPINEDTLIGYLGGIIAGRVSRNYNFRGPNFVVESACASSLFALACAVRGLRQGRFSTVVCGGVGSRITPEILSMISAVGALSRRGISPFDERADGLVIGEGAGILILKRLDEAIVGRHRILAVIKGLACSSDSQGRSVFAPESEGQARAVRWALENAKMNPEAIDYIECHGTGTPEGDLSEVQAYAAVYGNHGRPDPIFLSSVKSMIGHLNAAAGIAGLIRTVCALESGIIPPTLHFRSAHPDLPLAAGPFEIPSDPVPWPTHRGRKRRAAVSSFGLGGTNAHVILEEFTVPHSVRGTAVRTARSTYREQPCQGDWAGKPPVAVVGMGALFPGAVGTDGFHSRLLDGTIEFLDVPGDRFHADRYRSADKGTPDKTPQLHAAWLREIPFQPALFRIPPANVRNLHRMEQALLTAAHEAVTDSRILACGIDRERVAVFVGFTEHGTSSQKNITFLMHLPRMLESEASPTACAHLTGSDREALLRRVEAGFRDSRKDAGGLEDDFVSVYTSTAASCISMGLDLRGPHATLDTSSASAITALALGIMGLQDGRYDAVVVGGASPQVTPLTLAAFSAANLLSPSSRVAPFSADADGTLLGEGVGVLVLRRLRDAVENGQRIHAVIRGVGLCNTYSGSSPPFRHVPHGQPSAIRQAYHRAGYDPGTVQYVEATATGIIEADRAELDMLNQLFSPYASKTTRIAVGSLKERTGCLLAADGIAGMIRTLLALSDEQLPEQITCRRVHPDLDSRGGPFHVSRERAAWPQAPDGTPRRAAVNVIGFCGTGAHVVLEQYREDFHRGLPESPTPVSLKSCPVAVTGMGTVLPDSHHVEAFWDNLISSRQVSVKPRDVWYASEDPDWEGRARVMPARVALSGLFRPDPEKGRIAPEEVRDLDPTHIWLLEACRQALENAGIQGPLPEKSVLIVGIPPHGEVFDGLEARVAYAEFDQILRIEMHKEGLPPDALEAMARETEERFKENLPPLGPGTWFRCARSVAAGRVADRLGIRGGCFTVDTGCSSSCAAMELGVRGLVSRQWDLVLAAGVWGGITPEYLINTAVFGGNSAEISRPFDARADGSTPAEGAAALVLRRVEDARREGAVLHGILRGIGVSTTGYQPALFSVNTPAMVRAMTEALHEADVDRVAVGYVEAHGSCTPRGDAMEMEALARVFGEISRRDPLLIGCLRSHLGHLMSASGVSSMISLLLSLERGIVPPLLNTETPQEGFLLDAWGFRLPRTAVPWTPADGNRARIGALSSYALGGIHYFFVVEAPP